MPGVVVSKSGEPLKSKSPPLCVMVRVSAVASPVRVALEAVGLVAVQRHVAGAASAPQATNEEQYPQGPQWELALQFPV